jgi:hypothetical protein
MELIGMHRKYATLVSLLCLVAVCSLWALFNYLALPKVMENENTSLTLQGMSDLENDQSAELGMGMGMGTAQILEDLYSKGFTFNRIKNLYATILQEEEEVLLRELVMTFFESFSQASLTLDEYDKVQEMALDLVDNTKTRSMAIRRAAQILDENHMESIFDNYNYDLSQMDKQILAQQYMNLRLLNAVNETAHPGMKTLYENATSPEQHNRKINQMASMVSKTDKEHAKKIAEQNSTIENNDWDQNGGDLYDFIPWLRSKTLLMPPLEAERFLINHFTESDINFKNEFFISGIDLLDQIPIEYVANYVDSLNTSYLNALYGQRPFREFEISGILNLFRSLMKKSQNNELKLLIDKKIKTGIGTYPTYAGGILALEMIRDENIYIHENGFDIEDYLPENEGDEAFDKGEIEELF